MIFADSAGVGPKRGQRQKGYHRLAFDPRNYALLQDCQLNLKGNFFPVAGTPRLEAASPGEARAERPFLIFPVGGRRRTRREPSSSSMVSSPNPSNTADTDLFRHLARPRHHPVLRLNRPAPESAAVHEEGRENLYPRTGGSHQPPGGLSRPIETIVEHLPLAERASGPSNV